MTQTEGILHTPYYESLSMPQAMKHIHGYNGKKLTVLLRQLTLMGGQVESLLSQTLSALQTRDIHKAAQAAKHKDGFATPRQNIQLEAEKLLTHYYFGAHDLRRIMSAIKIASDIERIGDISANISQRLMSPDCMSSLTAVPAIKQLCKQTQLNVIAAIDALTHGNSFKAMQVYNAYDDIDRLHETLESEALSLMMHAKLDANTGAELISIIRYFERMAEHARNIAKKVYYAHTVDYLQDSAPDDGELQNIEHDTDSYMQKKAAI